MRRLLNGAAVILIKFHNLFFIGTPRAMRDAEN